MLPVLLRVRPDEWLAARTNEAGVPVVGVWFLLLAWGAYCGVAWWLSRRGRLGRTDEELAADEEAQRWTGLGGAAVLLSLPLWVGAVLPAAFAGVPVFGYGVMIFCGLVVGTVLGLRRFRQCGLPTGLAYDLAFWGFAAGIAGARLNYLVEFRQTVFASATGRPLPALEGLKRVVNLSDGGLVLLGGVLAATAAGVIVSRRWNVPFLRVADAVVPSLFVGMAFGRIGCLLYGCCYGDACSLPWAVHFPEGGVTHNELVARGFQDPAATRTFGLHPTQIYSSIDAAVLAFLTSTFFPRRPRDGAVLALAVLLYAPARSAIELLRADDRAFSTAGLTHAQKVTAILMLAGLGLAAYLLLAPRRETEWPVEGRGAAV